MKESEMRETVEKSKAIKAYKEVKQPYKLLCTSYYKLNIHRYILWVPGLSLEMVDSASGCMKK